MDHESGHAGNLPNAAGDGQLHGYPFHPSPFPLRPPYSLRHNNMLTLGLLIVPQWPPGAQVKSSMSLTLSQKLDRLVSEEGRSKAEIGQKLNLLRKQ